MNWITHLRRSAQQRTKMFDYLIEDLKRDEGWAPSLYFDSLGFATIGYGFLIDPKKDGELPIEIADLWLAHAVKERWGQLVKEIPWAVELPYSAQRALGNMAYQLGVKGVLNFKLMIKALKAGDLWLAGREALDSKWAEQTPKRAKRVARMMRGE